MNLYLISQDQNQDYDSYDSAVVAAPDEETARNIHPNTYPQPWSNDSGTWCRTPDKVTVEYLGIAKEETVTGVICASFNAG
jgi:hypothetical protein